MSISRKIQTFSTLPARELLAFFEAVLLLLAARLLVIFVPLSRWRKQFAVARENAGPVPEPIKPQRQTARMVRRSIDRVIRNSPMEFVCLPQALCARWMLSRRGIATQLYLGALRESGADREFHVWLKTGKIVITGHCDESLYAVFGSDSRS